MEGFAEVLDARSIRFERLLPGAKTRVWNHLAQSEQRRHWLAYGAFPARVGDTFEFHFRHAELSPDATPTPERFKPFESGHTVSYRLLARQAPDLLRYGWTANTCEAEFRLSANGEETRLVLTHSGLADRGEMVAFAAGWHAHLSVLEDVFHGRVPPAYWPMFDRIEQTYRQRLADL